MIVRAIFSSFPLIMCVPSKPFIATLSAATFTPSAQGVPLPITVFTTPSSTLVRASLTTSCSDVIR